jgi:hypothetical protein
MRFVVYEVWTQARVVEAPSLEDAYNSNQPEPREGLSLCNWHAVPLESAEPPEATGGLNYRQL